MRWCSTCSRFEEQGHICAPVTPSTDREPCQRCATLEQALKSRDDEIAALRAKLAYVGLS